MLIIGVVVALAIVAAGLAAWHKAKKSSDPKVQAGVAIVTKAVDTAEKDVKSAVGEIK